MSPAEVYKAMADDSRLRLINILSQGYLNVHELTSILDISQPTVSHHLKVLQGVGIIRNHREGTSNYYSLRDDEPGSFSLTVAKSFLHSVPSNGAETAEVFVNDARAVKLILNKRRDSTRYFFDSVAPKWKEIRGAAQGESYFEEVKKLIPPESTLLELGCGSGAFLEQIMPRNGKTIGVDYSQAMLEEAKQALGEYAQGVDLRLGYLEHLPLADESVDVALSYMVLHHVANPPEALQDAHRVLRPGEKLLVVDLLPHTNEFMRERYADLWLGFAPDEIKGWVKACGFKEIDLKILGTKKEAFLLCAIK